TVDGGREAFDDFDAVLWAIGRSPNTSGLWLDAAGVDTDDAGFVPTDEYQNTNVEGVYAIGDVTGRAALTPVAIAAGRRLADRLFDGQTDRHLEYKDIPTVIFTHPPIGTVGMTEPEAREHYGDDVRVYTSRFVSLYYQLSEHRPQTSMKLVTVGEEERVVGCHIIGDGADEMLQGFAVAVRMGAKKDDFDDTVAIHPTSAEELVTMR
ncbi:MAG: FAD-dependent oxidoreductase, partial [Gammaproteobacteria bacterium]